MKICKTLPRCRIYWNGDSDIWGLLYTVPSKRIQLFKLIFWKKSRYNYFFSSECKKKKSFLATDFTHLKNYTYSCERNYIIYSASC